MITLKMIKYIMVLITLFLLSTVSFYSYYLIYNYNINEYNALSSGVSFRNSHYNYPYEDLKNENLVDDIANNKALFKVKTNVMPHEISVNEARLYKVVNNEIIFENNNNEDKAKVGIEYSQEELTNIRNHKLEMEENNLDNQNSINNFKNLRKPELAEEFIIEIKITKIQTLFLEITGDFFNHNELIFKIDFLYENSKNNLITYFLRLLKSHLEIITGDEKIKMNYKNKFSFTLSENISVCEMYYLLNKSSYIFAKTNIQGIELTVKYVSDAKLLTDSLINYFSDNKDDLRKFVDFVEYQISHYSTKIKNKNKYFDDIASKNDYIDKKALFNHAKLNKDTVFLCQNEGNLARVHSKTLDSESINQNDYNQISKLNKFRILENDKFTYFMNNLIETINKREPDVIKNESNIVFIFSDKINMVINLNDIVMFLNCELKNEKSLCNQDDKEFYKSLLNILNTNFIQNKNLRLKIYNKNMEANSISNGPQERKFEGNEVSYITNDENINDVKKHIYQRNGVLFFKPNCFSTERLKNCLTDLRINESYSMILYKKSECTLNPFNEDEEDNEIQSSLDTLHKVKINGLEEPHSSKNMTEKSLQDSDADIDMIDSSEAYFNDDIYQESDFLKYMHLESDFESQNNMNDQKIQKNGEKYSENEISENFENNLAEKNTDFINPLQNEDSYISNKNDNDDFYFSDDSYELCEIVDSSDSLFHNIINKDNLNQCSDYTSNYQNNFEIIHGDDESSCGKNSVMSEFNTNIPQIYLKERCRYKNDDFLLNFIDTPTPSISPVSFDEEILLN